MPHVAPLVSIPTDSMLIGDEAAAVVGSVTIISAADAAGCPAVRGRIPVEMSNGTITRGTGFEIAPGVPGFSTSTVSTAAEAISEGASAIAHWPAVEQMVARAVPSIKTADAPAPLPAMKFKPRTARGNPWTAPAITLEGEIDSIVGPLLMTTVAVADFVVSASLVAVIVIAFGEGAVVGAV